MSLRKVIDAIFYITWRLLPHEFPAWQTFYGYYRCWTINFTWQRIHDTLRTRVKQKSGWHKHPTAGSIDSQSLKTTALVGIKGFDAGKKFRGIKCHILVDTLGLIMIAVVTAIFLIPGRKTKKTKWL